MASALKFIIATATFVTVGVSAVFAATVGTVDVDGVNVRSGSSTSAKVLTLVNKGQTVHITGKDGDFYHVFFKGVDDGYISTQFVTVKSGGAVAPTASNATSGASGEVTANKINIRSTASTDGKVLGQVNKGDKLTVLSVNGNWYKVMYKGAEAYITADFLSAPGFAAAKPAEPVQAPVVTQVAEPVANQTQVVEPLADQTQEAESLPVQAQEAADAGADEDSIYAVVTSDVGMYLRKEPSVDADILNSLAMGAAVDVLSIEDEWIQVVYGEQTGYLSKEFVEINRGKKPEDTQSSSGNPLADSIISYAKQFIGTPYNYGGNSLTKGVDCSGFVYAVLGNFNISVDRSSASMASRNGAIVQKSQLQPGDLVFFDTSGSNNGQVSHVGLYIGNGSFIHSSSSKKTWGVTISSLNEDYYKRTYVMSRRVL